MSISQAAPELALMEAYQAAGVPCCFTEGGIVFVALYSLCFERLLRLGMGKWGGADYSATVMGKTRTPVQSWMYSSVIVYQEFLPTAVGLEADLLNDIARVSAREAMKNFDVLKSWQSNETWFPHGYVGLTRELVRLVLESLPRATLVEVARLFFSDPHAYVKGWPDLTLVEAGQVRFVEVKTTDRLHASQIITMGEMKAATGMPLSVTRVVFDRLHRVLVPQSPSARPPARLTDIGTVEPICPHCSAPFPKMPSRKTKCRSCNNAVCSRTRPSDHKKVLLREADLEQLEEQWSVINGTHAEFFKERQRRLMTREALHSQFGKAPSDFDVAWRILNEDSLAFGVAKNWGFYRNTRFKMGESLRAEGRLNEALLMYLEVCYLDLNGPQNRGSIANRPDLAAEFPPFDASQAFLAPGVIDRCRKLASALQLPQVDLCDGFQKVAERNYRNLRLPVSPPAAWRTFEAEWADQPVT